VFCLVNIKFLFQRSGTKYISLLFAPIVSLWFAALFITGCINIATNDPGIFRAYNPAEAINYLVRTQDLDILGGVLLAITGVEALFADLGHYNRQSIQWAFSLIVYPSLILAYLGQAAALENHPEWISNTFYNTIPTGPGTAVYWIVFVLATSATVIASQAMILASFSIVLENFDVS
jgi:KUP system potassium uptake protein